MKSVMPIAAYIEEKWFRRDARMLPLQRLVDPQMLRGTYITVLRAPPQQRAHSATPLVCLGACRTWSVESENRPQRGQFLPGLQPHSQAMRQKDGEEWTAAADLQPTISKYDRLLDHRACHSGDGGATFRSMIRQFADPNKGFKLPLLIGHGALAASTATIKENCAIGGGAIVGSGFRIGLNTHISADVLLGNGSHPGSCVWNADGVQVEANSKVGSNATLGQCILLEDKAAIGRQCTLDLPGWRTAPLPDKTFVTAAFPASVVIVEGHQADLSG